MEKREVKPSIKCARLYGIGDLRYDNTDYPVCGEGEVIVQVKNCGICGSDIGRVYVKGTYHFPTIIGHEFAGKVVFTREKDQDLLGERVCVFPLLPCFHCKSCLEGKYATCEHYDYYGSRRDGGMAEYIAVKKWNLVKLPSGLSYEEGAMCEPVSVARHAVLKLKIHSGDTVFISGAGPIGLIAGKWARLFGAEKVYYTDIDTRKLEFAEKFGFHTYKEGVTVDCALEGTGCGDALEKCLEVVKPGGRLVFMGNPSDKVTLSQNGYWQILRKELKISGTWNSSYNDRENDWKESVRAMAEGKLHVKELITHRFPLSECNKAFEMMRNKMEFYNKVMLYMEESLG